MMDTTTADAVARLRSAELEAERRYLDAIINADLPAARNAATNWVNAADALTEYVATHPHLYRRSG
jgi:hypothetical protein